MDELSPNESVPAAALESGEGILSSKEAPGADRGKRGE